MQSILTQLSGAGIPFAEHEPLSRHTTFRIGGPVRALVLPRDEEELVRAVTILRASGQAPILIGNGSNMLAEDEPIERIAIKTFGGVAALRQMEDGALYVSGGASLARAAVFARELGLTGFEFAHGIPGTLGGAVYMNAGAYGGEMAQVVRCVHYLDEGLTPQVLRGEAIGFSYRHSRFSEEPNLVILGAEIALQPGEKTEIQARMDEMASKRRASQPLEFPSAGSTFKRPKAGYAAALIDQAGLKGYRIGGAEVSEKHAGFVVNRGGATCADVKLLMEHIQKTVEQRTGIMLEPEVALIR